LSNGYRFLYKTQLLTVKFGMLTPRVPKNPTALLKALNQAHSSAFPLKVSFGVRRDLFGGTLTNAHMSRANNVGGTMIDFAKKRYRSFWGEMNKKGN